MPPITKDQQVLSKIAQFNHALAIPEEPIWEKILLDIDDVNFKIPNNISDTLLHVACYNNHSQAFQALLSRGADYTAKNERELTALHQAFYSLTSQFGEGEDTDGTLVNVFIELVLEAHVEAGNSENPHSAVGLSHFHVACAFNHLEAVQLFLNGGVSINEAVDKNSSQYAGYTPLHFAVRFCGYETAKLLLERGADVNAKNAEGLTPLHVVVDRNYELTYTTRRINSRDQDPARKYVEENEKIIRLLLEDNRVLKVDEVGFSKFHAACTLRNSSLAEYWLRVADANCAINMNSPTFPGYTALHFAAYFNIETFESLLKKGADIDAKDAKGTIPLDLCLRNYDVKDVFNVLSRNQSFEGILFSDSETKLLDCIKAMQTTEMYEQFITSVSTDLHLPKKCPAWPGYSLSHLAVLFCQSGVNDIANKYFELGGEATIQDAHGCTSIHLVYYQQKDSLINVQFKSQRAKVDIIDNNGLSYLHIACSTRNTEVVQALLSTGAKVNQVYKGKTLSFRRLTTGSTPLHIAMKNRSIEIVKLLLKHGADANLMDDEGMTPLYEFTHAPLAIVNIRQNTLENATKEIGDLLLSSCELKNIVCAETGMSHLHFASLMGNAEAVERLLKLGADPNAVFLCEKIRKSFCGSRCFSGYTPMHFTLRNADTKILQLLLQGGADILKKKPGGMNLLYDALTHRICFLKNHEINMTIKETFVPMLENDAVLRKKLEDDSGLTLLHIACFLRDVDKIRSLLDARQVDVNAQMRDDSPIWPKATPLHLLFESRDNKENLENAVKLLLDVGANVTLMNQEGYTPVHRTWSNRHIDPANHLLRLVLRHQTDFTINPVNIDGISHFHLACAIGEYTIVEKFLENGVDVNLPIDCCMGSMTFQTPLHFMLRSKKFNSTDAESHSKTMDVLLKYGADVSARDENGSTPFLEVGRSEPRRKLFFQKLHKAGVDVNGTDMYGHTILEMLLFSPKVISSEELEILLSYPNLFNTFNSLNGIGILATIIDKRRPFPNRAFILEAIMKLPGIFTIDSMGRTPIHNIVANPKTTLSTAEYANYIERFVKMGFNIDAQDSTGKTALHIAAHFHNEEALCGLLIAGADVNITDMSNETLFAKLGVFHNQWRSAHITKVDKIRLTKRIAYYIISMQLCGLEANSENLAWAKRVVSGKRLQIHRKKILKELKDSKLVKIGTGTLTLRDFLTETGAVASRPSMICDTDRDAVDKYFETIDTERFPELSYLFKLQYRKMLKRMPLMEEATDSLREILGNVNEFSMPDICCRMVLRFLTNTEVNNLILSV